MALELITTEDGSHSLLNTALNETYHSVHGAVRESLHVFIRSGLDHYHQRHSFEKLVVLEAGFGTGLNALLALDWAIRTNVALHFTSVESSPLPHELVERLNYTSCFPMKNAVGYFEALHAAAWNEPVAIHPLFVLEKRMVLLGNFEPAPGATDLVFFDAFAPSKQPELWELPILQKMKYCLKREGVFVTYCAKGQLKRDLKSLSFSVETLEGPPGKKEMVRATLL